MVGMCRRHYIFRPDAVQRYIKAKGESVLPRFPSPRTSICLWLLLGLLSVSGLIVWFTNIPVYASGTAIVVDGTNIFQDKNDGVYVVAFLPPENLSQLSPGQTMFLNTDGVRLRKPIAAIESEISSPAAAMKRFGFNSNGLAAITQPSAIAIAHLGAMPTDMPISKYIGSVYRVDVHVGSCRIISFIPVIGKLFQG
jgi:hypothetical protein